MIRRTITGCFTFLLVVAAAQAHDLFLRLDSYVLQPNSKAIVRVLNGTFQKSDGAVARERLAHLSFHGSGLTLRTSIRWCGVSKIRHQSWYPLPIWARAEQLLA